MKKLTTFLSFILLIAVLTFFAWSFFGGLSLTYQGAELSESHGSVWVSTSRPLQLEVNKPLLRSYSYRITTVDSPALQFASNGSTVSLAGNLDASKGFDVVVDGSSMTVTPKGEVSDVIALITGIPCNVLAEDALAAGDLFTISFYYGEGPDPVTSFSFGIAVGIPLMLPEGLVF